MSFEYSFVISRNKVSELVLLDVNQLKAEGEAMDLQHAAVYNTTRVRIKAGDYSDCRDAEIIVIAAGAAQLPGETRRDLVKKNTAIFRDIIGQVNKTGFKGIYLIATNPVDVMTQVTQKLSNLPHTRVIGSGTTLDTARLRFKLAQTLGAHPRNAFAYVVGEHGDSSFIPWSISRLGPTAIGDLLNAETKQQILHDTRQSAYEIIARKGSTHFGIGIMLRDIVEAILENSKEIKTVSVPCPKTGVYMGLPAILGRDGVVSILPLTLSTEEQSQMAITLGALRETLAETGVF